MDNSAENSEQFEDADKWHWMNKHTRAFTYIVKKAFRDFRRSSFLIGYPVLLCRWWSCHFTLNPLIALETENFTLEYICNSDTICPITAQMFDNIKLSYYLTDVWKEDGPEGISANKWKDSCCYGHSLVDYTIL